MEAGPVNQASSCRMIGWLIADVAWFTKFTNALTISRYRRDPALGHEYFRIDGKRILKSAPLPANEQASEQAYMCSQHSAVGAHAPDPPAIVGCLLVDFCRFQFPIANKLYSQLSWSQYKLYIRLESQYKRDFYIAETVKNNWTVRQLERQINSSLWERLLLSNDRESILAIARSKQNPSDAKEIIKDPMYQEFLGLKRESSYYEKDLE